MLEEAEKLYNILVDQLVCEVVNENIAKQSSETMPSSLPHYIVEPLCPISYSKIGITKTTYCSFHK